MNYIEESESSKDNYLVRQEIKYFVVLIGFVLLIALIILNSFFREELFINGINFIFNYQYNWNHWVAKVINNLFSILCHPFFVSPLLLLYFLILHRKLRSLVHISYFILCTYVMAVLKQSYQQSRPIWYKKQIQLFEWFCPHDFGHPSGHSFAVFMLYEPLITDCWGMSFLKWIILCILGIMIPLSRMYLGVHSADQIVMGLTLGIILICMYRYLLQEYVYRLHWSLLCKKNIYQLLSIIFVQILCILVPLIIFLIYTQNNQVNQADLKNMNTICRGSLTGQQLQGKMMKSCSLVHIVFGCFYGMFIISNNQKNKLYFMGYAEIKYYDWKQNGLDLLTCIVLVGIPLALFVILIPFLVHQHIIVYFSMVVGLTLAGIALIYAIQRIAQNKKKYIDIEI